MVRLILWFLAGCAPDNYHEPELITQAPPAPVELTLAAPSFARPGSRFTLTSGRAQPGDQVMLLRGTGVGQGPCLPELGGQCIDLLGPLVIEDTEVANTWGVVTFHANLPQNLVPDTEVYWQAVVQRGPGFIDSVTSTVERTRVHDSGARMRFIHASPDVAEVDVYADGALIAAAVPYLDTSAWIDVTTGGHVLDVRPAGANPTSAPLFTETVGFGAGDSTMPVLIGLAGSTDPESSLRIDIIGTGYWGSQANGQWRAHVFHASPDAPAAGFDFGDDGSVELRSMPRFSQIAAEGWPLPTSDVRIGIGGKVSVTLPPIPTGAGLHLITTGLVSARPNAPDAFGVLVVDEDGVVAFVRRDPTLYVLNASPGASTLDVQAGAARLADDLAFQALAGPLRVSPGDAAIDLLDGATGAPIGAQTLVGLAAGESYLVVAGGAPLQLIQAIDDAAFEPAASLRMIQASPDAPSLDVGPVLAGSVNPTWTGLDFGEVGAAVALPRAPFELGVAEAAGPLLYGFRVPELRPGRRVVGVTTGLIGDGSFALTVVDQTGSPWRVITLPPSAQY
jgi:hypothetical protein